MPVTSVRSTDERILDATLLVLARRGGSRLSMSDVARTAGVSRMTLYRYYSTKDELLRALARHEQRRFDERLERALADATTPTERVDAVLAEIVSFQAERATRAVVEAEPEFILERMRRALPVQRRTLERLLGDALERSPAVRAGDSTPGDVAELVLRVAMSHFLIPHRDPDALLGVLRGSLGFAPTEGRRPRRRAS
ncbi:MAG TPA: TetR/AcrR family transcriptional regulator [Acidimicrobiia bacterium]|nr:TetR/AcrR family transcriptional regulator [Acidimicrobiia bacterium]